MIVSRRIESNGDNTVPSAVESPIRYRGGTEKTVNKKPRDDEASLKLQGRHVSEKRQLKTRKQVLKIGTWNVRTLYKPGRYENLKAEMIDMKLDILGVCETRWTDNGRIDDKDNVMIYSGGEKHMYGVGILMKKSIANSMIGFWPVSDRVIMMKLNGSPFNINIIQVYAPTQDHEEEDVEKFYECIAQVLEYTKSGEITIIMGDWNAKVGRHHEYPVTGKHGLGDINEQGERMLDFCRTSKVVIANTLFQHPKRRLYTWSSPGDLYRNQIDFIMVSQRHRNCIKQTKTYPSADVNSDHNPVVMDMKVKLKHTKKKKNYEQLDMNMLKEEQYKQRYNVKVSNIYEHLNHENSNHTDDDLNTNPVEKEWEMIHNSMVQAAKELLTKRKRGAKQKWMNEEILELMKESKANRLTQI